MSWQKLLAEGFTSSVELLEFLRLPIKHASFEAEQEFKVRVPRGFAQRMQPENPYDPLLLQVLAGIEETLINKKYVADPLLEKDVNPAPGLIHKYKGRVLMIVTGACAINCRYCFRRHFPYQDNHAGSNQWHVALSYIENDPSITEVILSGGDPLLLSDKKLSILIAKLSAIKHLKSLRFHTRIPIVLPARINSSLLSATSTDLRKIMVLHCNHAQEISPEVQEACKLLKSADFSLLNQSVLLKKVNDDVKILVDLSEALFTCGVLPYYLHLLDKVRGAAHFDIPLMRARLLYQELQAQLPGYLLPRLVCETPKALSKTIIV